MAHCVGTPWPTVMRCSTIVCNVAEALRVGAVITEVITWSI